MDKRNGFSLEQDLAPIMAGKAELPNMKELSLEQGIAAIACGGGMLARPGVEYVKIPGSQRMSGVWARYFLIATQGGSFDGTGYVIWYDSSKHPAVGRVAKFAICDHVKEDGAGADHSRGWHPGRCTKCGLDMSVDSGD